MTSYQKVILFHSSCNNSGSPKANAFKFSEKTDKEYAHFIFNNK